jgi:hypothetical protein
MKIKHIYITNFSSLVKNPSILSISRLELRLTLFKRTLFSIEQQMNSHGHVVIINKNIPDVILNELKNLNIHLFIIENRTYRNFYQGISKFIIDTFDITLETCDLLITTRIDDDDLLFKYSNKTIQITAMENINRGITIIGFDYGCLQNYPKHEYSNFICKHRFGFISVGLSVAIDFKKYHSQFISHNLHAFHGDHTLIINNIGKVMKCKIHSIAIKTKIPCYIYVRHEFNDSKKINIKPTIDKELINKVFYILENTDMIKI